MDARFGHAVTDQALHGGCIVRDLYGKVGQFVDLFASVDALTCPDTVVQNR
jgi:hypothetical protein